MMRTSTTVMMRASAARLATVFPSSAQGMCNEDGGSINSPEESLVVFPTTERGVHSSSLFQENNTAVYDAFQPFTYFQPVEKIQVEKIPEPDAKYYQVNTRRHWDITWTEWNEIVNRKKMFMLYINVPVVMLATYFLTRRSMSFAGERGYDVVVIGAPKNQPHLF